MKKKILIAVSVLADTLRSQLVMVENNELYYT